MISIALSRADDTSEGSQEAATLLIEPRSLTRQCLSAWLEQSEPNINLLAFKTPEAAIDHPGADVALIVWCIGASSMASNHVIDRLQRLRNRHPTAPLALLADREDPAEVRRALQHGVNGYVPTSLDRGQVLEVLRFLRAGGTYVPASALIDGDGPPPAHDPAPTSARHRPETSFDDLTPREVDVMEQLRQGKPNKVIAHELNISESTVKVFVHRILYKLGAVNRTEVAYLAQQQAILTKTPSEPVA